MKQSDQIKDTPLPSVFDQSWASFLNPAGRLRLNTLDFSDLWDEEDLGLDSTEEDGGPAQTPPLPPIPPPLPPSAPPLSRYSPTDRPPGSRTLKLHWRELQSLPPLPRVTRFGTQTIWAGLEPVNLDTNRLEYLFESKRNSAICSLLSGWRVGGLDVSKEVGYLNPHVMSMHFLHIKYVPFVLPASVLS